MATTKTTFHKGASHHLAGNVDRFDVERYRGENFNIQDESRVKQMGI